MNNEGPEFWSSLIRGLHMPEEDRKVMRKSIMIFIIIFFVLVLI
jgi:cytochrome c1